MSYDMYKLFVTFELGLFLLSHFSFHKEKKVIVLARCHHSFNKKPFSTKQLFSVQDILALVIKIARSISVLNRLYI
jgi:hypothetical protein